MHRIVENSYSIGIKVKFDFEYKIRIEEKLLW